MADKHGAAVLSQTGEFANGNKSMANVAITSVTADAAGLATVSFTVKDSANAPVTTVASVSAGIFKLVPKGSGISYNKWVSYIWREETVSGSTFPKPNGTKANQAYRESSGTGATNGTLVNNGGGSYTYTFKTNLASAKFPDGTAITYDRTLTHRVSIYTGGHSGPTGESDKDFIPAGGTITETRNIVETATCKKCHGPEFAGHGGDRVTVEGCVTCHSPGSNDAQSGNSIEMAVMIHKIHAGNELASVAGPDMQYYDNPNTVVDETANNGEYVLYGYGNRAISWEGAAFPAVLANCQACHTEAAAGSLSDVDHWKTVPSRTACGSCHDNVNFATGANHSPANRIMTNDDTCFVCHPDTGAAFGQSVADAHKWSTKDIRNIQEFDITVTTDTPARGYYINGEKPVVTIVLNDKATGATLDHTTIAQDSTAEGCIPRAGSEGTACTVARDGLFTAANVYVVGPRAEKVVNLTYAARATVRSANAGPWDLSAGGGSLRVKVDSGMPMLMYNNEKAYEGYGADELITGDITVTLPAAGAALNALFANPAAATAAEVAAWLNANAIFKERAIAYVDEALAGNSNAGKLAIRSRGVSKKNNIGEVIETNAQRNIQLVTMPVAGMFAAADTAPATTSWKTAGGADSLRKMTVASATNPKAVFSAANIKYTLDPVDDLVAGTYIIHVEFADGGRAPAPANPAEPPYVDYRTPSVALATFQVKTATEEKPVAGNCTACHWSSAGVGFILDFPRHNKIFDEKAVDRCGGCHDYLSGEKPDATTQLRYAGSLSNRVHSVHNGSNLNYPTITVGHEETAAFGRNWRITYPMNIRNCESCHPAATTSGTWKTNPNRLACMGCHDSDAATTHMKMQTYDLTPLAPWSGDESESCKSCH
ncbi:MAG TPA: OmcA/MtrC family decaheme c-type cytochrome [Syntrophales bacterium]|nr:OmcA/MtrC family decaheme c-type cytochrome [Syntrophales bacterium]